MFELIERVGVSDCGPCLPGIFFRRIASPRDEVLEPTTLLALGHDAFHGSSHSGNEWLLKVGLVSITVRGGSSHFENGWLLEGQHGAGSECAGSSHSENEWLLEVVGSREHFERGSSHFENGWLMEG